MVYERTWHLERKWGSGTNADTWMHVDDWYGLLFICVFDAAVVSVTDHLHEFCRRDQAFHSWTPRNLCAGFHGRWPPVPTGYFPPRVQRPTDSSVGLIELLCAWHIRVVVRCLDLIHPVCLLVHSVVVILCSCVSVCSWLDGPSSYTAWARGV